MPLYGIRSAFLAGDPLGDVVELFLRREDAESGIRALILVAAACTGPGADA